MLKSCNREDIDFTKLVNDAYKERLFIPEYTFEQLLTEYDDLITSIYILYGEDGAIGLGLTWTYYEKGREHIGVFVKPQYRRQGYGTHIIACMGGIRDRIWSPGEPETGRFFIAQT